MKPAKKECPECAEDVEVTAFRCNHCGANLEEKPVFTRVRTPFVERRVSCFAWLGLFVGIPATVICAFDAFRWGSPDLEELLVLGFFTFLVVGGVLLIVRDLGRPEAEKSGKLYAGILTGCVGVPVVWVLSWFTLGAAALMLFDRRPPGYETAAIGALKTIGTAQSLYREADKEGDGNLDYGSLKELANSGTTGLIDSVLGSGTKMGYLFECTYGASTSEFIWFATARPAVPGTTGDRYFATNHEGVTYYTTNGAFSLDNVTCEISDHAIPVGGSGRNRADERVYVKQQRTKHGAPLTNVKVGQVYVFRDVYYDGDERRERKKIVDIQPDRLHYVDDTADHPYVQVWEKIEPGWNSYEQRQEITAAGRKWICNVEVYSTREVYTALEQNTSGVWVVTWPGRIKEVEGDKVTYELLKIEEN